MKNYFEVNLNNLVKVRLTEFDLFWWHHQLSEVISGMPAIVQERIQKTFTDLKMEADEDGYHEFQLWDLMNIFGAYTRIGEESCFEGNVMLIESPEVHVDPEQEVPTTDEVEPYLKLAMGALQTNDPNKIKIAIMAAYYGGFDRCAKEDSLVTYTDKIKEKNL